MINDKNIKQWRVAVLAICATCFIIFIWALCNVPSKNMYNPYKTDKRQNGAQGYLVPPPCINAVDKSYCEYTHSQIEQYSADRSDLAAQWGTADRTHMAYYAGLLGISLLILTFFETYVGGREFRRQTNVATRATKAEFQPYLKFSKRLEFGQLHVTYCPEEEHRVVVATAIRSDHHIQVAPRIQVTNRGKTPATNLFVTHAGKITNDFVRAKKVGPRKTEREVLSFYGSRAGPLYIGIDDEKSLDISLSIVFDRQKEAKYINDAASGNAIYEDTRNMTLINACISFSITVSFSDQFSEIRRAFHLGYIGRFDTNWVTLQSSRELLPHEQEYIKHQKQFDAFIQGPKHQDTPNT